MKILLDTNVLYSLINWPDGHISKLIKFYQNSNDLYLCPYVLEELKEIMFKKKTITNIKEFKDIVQRIAEVIFDLQFKMINSIPKKEYLYHTRDKTDDRILDAAICGNIDAILTGDKDLINFRCPKVQILNIHHQLI